METLISESRSTAEHNATFDALYVADLIPAGMDQSLESMLERSDATLANLGRQLREGLSEHRWATLIGDDTSGRLPALFVRRLASDLVPHSNNGEGTPPQLQFVAAGYEASTSKAPENVRDTSSRIDSLKLDPKGRVLIVTETLSTGIGLTSLLTELSSRGVSYDLATVYSSLYADDLIRQLEDLGVPLPQGMQVFIGGTQDRGALNELSRLASGVKKVRGRDLTTVDTKQSMDDVESARNYMHALADAIAQEDPELHIATTFMADHVSRPTVEQVEFYYPEIN